ncbi:DUF4189 domain-containing protein [Stenotrophomonas sp. NPDC077659]|uniref:DUF4189 domain-containing protein n=1 Tax=Stenotrophomonas sp. NPDC077659 TaxID=3390694 RepID=UPI003CFF7BDC
MTRFARILTVCSLLFPVFAAAQQPGTPEYNSVYLPAHGVGDTKPQALRWGGWARGDDRRLGFTVSGRTEEEARALAVADCESRGSVNCVPLKTFYNACAAIAEGPTDRTAITTDRGLKRARSQALKNCRPDCKIIFEGCALP